MKVVNPGETKTFYSIESGILPTQAVLLNETEQWIQSGISINPVSGIYYCDYTLPQIASGKYKLYFYPGSTAYAEEIYLFNDGQKRIFAHPNFYGLDDHTKYKQYKNIVLVTNSGLIPELSSNTTSWLIVDSGIKATIQTYSPTSEIGIVIPEPEIYYNNIENYFDYFIYNNSYDFYVASGITDNSHKDWANALENVIVMTTSPITEYKNLMYFTNDETEAAQITASGVYLYTNDLNTAARLTIGYIGTDPYQIGDYQYSNELYSAYANKSFANTDRKTKIMYGYHPSPDMRLGANWYDTITGEINTTGDAALLNDADLQNLADLGYGYFAFHTSVATKTGRAKLTRLRELNPQFEYGLYLNIAEYPRLDINPDLAPINTRPWYTYLYETYSGISVVDVSGLAITSWPPPSYSGLQGWNYIDFYSTPTPGYTFNKDRVDAWVSGLKHYLDQAPYQPIHIMLDYYNNASAGPYVWPDYENYAPDLLLDSIPYSSNSSAQQSYRDRQIYHTKEIRKLFPSNTFLYGNGSGAFFDSTEDVLVSGLDGIFMENFPQANAFNKTLVAIVSGLYQYKKLEPTQYRNILPFNKLLWFTDIQRDIAFSGVTDYRYLDAARASVFLFDGIYRYPCFDSNGHTITKLTEPGFEYQRALLGNPTGEIQVENTEWGQRYYRSFEGGTPYLIIDPTQTGDAQLVEGGVTEATAETIFAGRVPLVDIRSGANWYDTAAGNINTGADGLVPTDEDLETIANVGFAYISFNRVATKTGRAKLAKIREYNPNFQYAVYIEYSAYYSGITPGNELVLPWNTWQYQNQLPALNVSGTIVRRNPTVGWVDYMSNPTSGYTFNKDTIDALIDEFKTYWYELPYKPIALKFDYFNNSSTGYYEAVGELEADLDQDGTPYASDSEEQQSFKDAQEYYVQAFRDAVGTDVALLANGNAVQFGLNGEPDLKALLNGPYLEAYPDIVYGGLSIIEVTHDIYQSYIGTSPFKSFKDNKFLFMIAIGENRDFINGDAAEQLIVDAGRMLCILFDGWYRYDSETGTWDPDKIVDPIYNSYVSQLGDPVGLPTMTTSGLVATFSREFSGGTAYLSLNSGLAGTSQIVGAGIL